MSESLDCENAKVFTNADTTVHKLKHLDQRFGSDWTQWAAGGNESKSVIRGAISGLCCPIDKVNEGANRDPCWPLCAIGLRFLRPGCAGDVQVRPRETFGK